MMKTIGTKSEERKFLTSARLGEEDDKNNREVLSRTSHFNHNTGWVSTDPQWLDLNRPVTANPHYNSFIV